MRDARAAPPRPTQPPASASRRPPASPVTPTPKEDVVVAAERIVGVDRLLARVAGTAHDVLQLAPGILDARLNLLKVRGLEVAGGEVNLPLRALGRTVPHLATITLHLACPGGGVVNGRRVETGAVVVWRPGASYDGVAPAGDRWVTLLVPWAELPRRAGVARRGTSWRWNTSLLTTELRADEREAAEELAERTRALADASRGPVPLGVAETLRDAWLGLVGPLFARAAPSPPPRGATWSATLDVRAAERYLYEHLEGEVYLADVSRATGVPPRTLQAAFRHVLGCSPMAYLETLRLHAVLRALRNAGPAPTTAREIARSLGFRHYPRFSAAFRARFVASPSELLRAAREASA